MASSSRPSGSAKTGFWPDWTSGGRRRRARPHVLDGNAARDLRDWPAAAEAYRRALAIAPEMAHIWVQLGHAAKEAGDFDRAERAYHEAIDREPDNGDTHLNLGHLLKVRGRPSEALVAYRRAIRLEPGRDDWEREATAAERLAGAATERGVAAEPAHAHGGIDPALLAQLWASLRPETDEDRADRPDVWFDVADLVMFFGHSRLPTGIQRVQIEVVSALLREPPAGARLGVCAYSEARGGWSRAPSAVFLEVARLALSGGDASAAEWRVALARLEGSLSAGGLLAFRRGDALVNLGASWAQGNHHLALRLEKARCGLFYAPCIFDLIPLVAPGLHVEDLTRDYLGWLTAVLSHADGVFAISEHSLKDFREAAVVLGADAPEDRQEVIPLNAALTTDRGAEPDPEVLRKFGLRPGGFVLFVSTIEPRKGHLTAFGAWERLVRELGPSAPKLVCVGRLGWMQEATLAKLKGAPSLRDRVQIASGVSDDELHTLYATCAFTLYASVYEGWGLPITESLSYGKVPLTSDHPSVIEAGGGVAELFETGSERSLADAALRLWTDGAHRAELERRIAQDYRGRRWAEVGAQVVAAVDRWRAPPSAPRRGARPFALPLGRYFPLGRNRRTTLEAGVGTGEPFRHGDGWLGPEWWGCWTRPDGAMLVAASPGGAGRLRLYLGLRSPPGRACGYVVRVDGETVADGRLAADAVNWVCRTLPEGAGREGELTIAVAGDVSWSVEGAPPRAAGVGVVGLMLCEETDLAARSAFIEEHLSDRLEALA